MSIPQPKYDVGQIVWRPNVRHESRRLQCPDCLDTGNWTITTPAGETFETQCARCDPRYSWRRIGPPVEQTFSAEVERLTIGSVRLDTNDEHPVSYMCRETGVGSGTIHREETLFLTEEEARRVAEADASRRHQELREQHEEVHHKDVLSHLTWTNAGIQEAEQRRRKFQYMLEDVLFELDQPHHETADQLRDTIRRIIDDGDGA